MRASLPLLNPQAHPHACTPAVRLHVLGLVPMFRDLTAHELAQVDSRCRVQGFGAGEAIYHHASPAEALYVVVTGAVKIQRDGREGREVILDLCGPGDFLGAVPALGQKEFSGTAWALGATCLLTFSATDFAQILRDFPPVTLATLRGVSHRFSRAQEAVHLLSAAPLAGRLAAMLLLLSEKIGTPWNEGILLQVPLSREELAAMVGATPESVSRILSTWRKQGFIESGRQWLAIQDSVALEELREKFGA